MNSIFSTIEKPTLVLDETITRRNIQRMAEKARRAGIAFRPHFKTHQSAEIGEWFRAEGVSAITVSSVDMALYFADHGWNDITIAFSANPRQVKTLAELARRVHLGLLVESAETVARLAAGIAAPVDIWLKIDVGARRTGLPWDQPTAIRQVIDAVRIAPHFTLKGLLTHAGHTYGARGMEAVCQRYRESVMRMDDLRQALQLQGSGPLLVSVGDTPASTLCPDLGPVDELRPGNFVFYDTMQAEIGACRYEDIAVALACPVVAIHPERCQAVVYGGAVHLSKDFIEKDGHRAYGLVALPSESGWSAPLAGGYVSALSQEHGILTLQSADLANLHVGDLVCILPAHSCLTVTLMKRYLTLDGNTIDTMNV